MRCYCLETAAHVPSRTGTWHPPPWAQNACVPHLADAKLRHFAFGPGEPIGPPCRSPRTPGSSHQRTSVGHRLGVAVLWSARETDTQGFVEKNVWWLSVCSWFGQLDRMYFWTNHLWSKQHWHDILPMFLINLIKKKSRNITNGFHMSSVGSIAVAIIDSPYHRYINGPMVLVPSLPISMRHDDCSELFVVGISL